MRKAYFILSFCFALFGLIIAFENIATKSQVLILFSSFNKSLFFSFIIMMVIGIAAGFFLGLGSLSKKGESTEDEY
jgi:F0F1-type ATP synthase assembly protein I